MGSPADLRRALQAVGAQLRRELDAAAQARAVQVQVDERLAVPYDTRPWRKAGKPHLRDGIQVHARTDIDVGRRVGIDDPSLFYGRFIEHGRKNADAQPFVLPAWQDARVAWQRDAARITGEVIGRAQR